MSNQQPAASRQQAAEIGQRWLVLLLIAVAVALSLGGCAPSPTPAVAATQTGRETPLSATTAPTGTAAMPLQTAVSVPATSPVQPTGVYTRTDAAGYVDTYFVDPNLEDTTPPLGGRVLVRARLRKNGVRAGAMGIEVSWMQDGELQHCQFLPIYQSGCLIEVRGYPPGVFVPVTVTVRYGSEVFMGYGGFTPE